MSTIYDKEALALNLSGRARAWEIKLFLIVLKDEQL